jgi:hypothetical protein
VEPADTTAERGPSVTARTARMLARADVRRAWRGVIGIGLIAAVAGGAVLALVLGARRTQTAYARLVDAGDYAQVRVDMFGGDQGRVAAVRSRPEVADSMVASGYVGRRDATEDWVQVSAVADPRALDRLLVVRGRVPSADAPDEVVLTEHTAAVMRLRPGDRFATRFYSAAQFPDVQRDVFVPPSGAHVAMRVVGLTRDPSDAQLDAAAKVITAGPGFRARYGPATQAVTTVFAWLAPGADVARLRAYAERSSSEGGTSVHVLGAPTASLGDNRRAVVIGLLLCALLAAAAGLLALGQAAVRQVARSAGERRTLVALGTTRGGRVMAAFFASWPVAAVGALGAVIVAVALSPLFPVGLLRSFEPYPGVEVNVLGLALGAMAVAVVSAATMTGAALLVDRRANRPAARPRPPRSLQWLVGRGARPPVVVGVGMAVQPSPGSGVPVRSAFVGTAFAIAGIVAALGFGTSLARFVTTPERYGLDWDVSVEANGRRVAMEHDLARRRGVDAVATVRTATPRIGGQTTDLYTIDPVKGTVQATIVHGRAPATDGEIAMGADVRRRLGVAIGEAVTVPGADGDPVPLRVVGESLPLDPQTERGLAGTMLVTPAAFDRLVPRTDPSVALEAAVRFAPGADREPVIRMLRADYPGALTDESRPDRPVEVRNLAQLGALPLVLGGSLLAIGLAAIGHALFTVARRRRRDLAVLRTVGFTGRQLGATLLAMAGTVLVAGLVVGIPIGLLVARLAWGGVARDLAVDPTLTSPVVPLLGALLAGILVVAVASLSVRSARHLATAAALRSE